MPAPSSSESFDGLLQWLSRNSAIIDDSVEIRRTANAGRGLFLTGPLKQSGGRFVQIPGSLLMSSAKALAACPSIPALLERISSPSSPQSAALVLFILQESHKGEESNWYHFLNSCPKQFDGPVFWSEEKRRRLLGYTPVGVLADSLREELEDIYKDIIVAEACKNWPSKYGAYVSLERFLWAYGFVESRSFQVTKENTPSASVNELQTETLLVPFVDMANHPSSAEQSKRAVRKDYDHTADEFYLEWPDDEAPSAGEFYLQYGAYPNWQLLLSYGFAVSENTADTVELQLDYPGDSQESYDVELRKLLFLEMHSKSVSLSHSLRPDQKLADSALWHSLRLVLATEEEIQGVTTQSLMPWLSQPTGVSPRNETVCRETVNRMLQSLRKTFEDHSDNPAGPDSSPAATIYRREQCRIIDSIIAELDNQDP